MKDPQTDKPKASKRQQAEALPLQELLEQADVYTLRNFLRRETKRNKQLTIRLKTRLIESVSLTGIPNKYHTLVSEIIREDVHGIVKLPRREVKLLHETILSLLKIADNEMASQAYRESYLILFGILVNLHRYLDKTDEDSDILHDVLIKTYERLQILISRDLAPELRDDIQDDAYSLVEKSYHKLPDIKFNALSVALVDLTSPKRLEQLALVAEERLGESGRNIAWVAWYTILRDMADKNPDPILLLQVLEPSEIVRLADVLFESGYDTAGYRWVNAFDGKVDIAVNQRSKWKKWKFEASSFKGQHSQVLDTGVELMLETSDYSYLDKMKGVVDPDQIASALAEEKAFDVLARLYIKHENWDRLRQVIDESRDIGIISRNLEAIVSNTDDAEGFIRQQVRQFLTHRAGTNCSAELNQLLEALEMHKKTRLAGAVRDEIFTTYPGRFVETAEGLDISY